jgi:hypothetical protein
LQERLDDILQTLNKFEEQNFDFFEARKIQYEYFTHSKLKFQINYLYSLKKILKKVLKKLFIEPGTFRTCSFEKIDRPKILILN